MGIFMPQRLAILNQRGQVGRVKGDAGRGLAVVFDPTPLRFGDCRIRGFVAMMGKRRSERGNGMS